MIQIATHKARRENGFCMAVITVLAVMVCIIAVPIVFMALGAG